MKETTTKTTISNFFAFVITLFAVVTSSPIFGQELRQSVNFLVNTEKEAGFYDETWKARNLPSGIYLIRIIAEGLSSNKNFIQVKKALLLK